MSRQTRLAAIVCAIALSLAFAGVARAKTESFRIGNKIVIVMDAPEPEPWSCSSVGICICKNDADCDDMEDAGVCNEKTWQCDRRGQCACHEK